MIKCLEEIVSSFVFTEFRIGDEYPVKCFSAKELSLATKFPCEVEANCKQALEIALKKEGKVVCVTGSLYLIGNVLTVAKNIFKR